MMGSATWSYTYNQASGRIITAQHWCGVHGNMINARLDDADNWYCPKCGDIYAAANQADYFFLKKVKPQEPPDEQELADLKTAIEELNNARWQPPTFGWPPSGWPNPADKTTGNDNAATPA